MPCALYRARAGPLPACRPAMAEGDGVVSEMSWRAVLAGAERELAAAGVPSPRVDAELLAAHVLGIPRAQLALLGAGRAVEQDRLAEFRALIARRATRVPLQHL